MCLAHVTIVYIILGMNFKYFAGILGVAVVLYVIWLEVVHIFRNQPKGKGGFQMLTVDNRRFLLIT